MIRGRGRVVGRGLLGLANGNPGKIIARPASSFDKSGQASRGICRCMHGHGWSGTWHRVEEWQGSIQ